MAATSVVQTRIDPELKDRAAQVLESMGLTISDAVRILLTRIANEGALPFDFAVDPKVHDAWFRAKVREALNDPVSSAPDGVKVLGGKRRADATKAGPVDHGHLATLGAKP